MINYFYCTIWWVALQIREKWKEIEFSSVCLNTLDGKMQGEKKKGDWKSFGFALLELAGAQALSFWGCMNMGQDVDCWREALIRVLKAVSGAEVSTRKSGTWSDEGNVWGWLRIVTQRKMQRESWVRTVRRVSIIFCWLWAKVLGCPCYGRMRRLGAVLTWPLRAACISKWFHWALGFPVILKAALLPWEDFRGLSVGDNESWFQPAGCIHLGFYSYDMLKMKHCLFWKKQLMWWSSSGSRPGELQYLLSTAAFVLGLFYGLREHCMNCFFSETSQDWTSFSPWPKKVN